jgi:hypothetical protein
MVQTADLLQLNHPALFNGLHHSPGWRVFWQR